MIDFRIDDRIRSHIPPLRAEERRQLEDNILANGCQSPLIVWDGILIDGHNRYEICLAHGVRFSIEEIELADFDAAIDWIEDNQLGRRNLTADQFSYFIGRKYDRAKRAVGENQHTRPDQNDHPSLTAEKIAKQHGVGSATVRRAADFARDVDAVASTIGDEARAEILAGSASLSRAEVREAAEELPKAKSDGLVFATPKEAFQWVKDQRTEKQTQKREARDTREMELSSKLMALPEKRYAVVLADPEWRFEPFSRETGMDRAADNHYPTSELDQIKARDVASIAADDCVLFLWATAPMLPQAIEVMAAWGFTYKSCAVWAKDRIGTGYWFRNKHELLLVGTRGSVPAPAMGTQSASLIEAPVGRHSEKPVAFYEIIEGYFPNLPKIELNARVARPGWDVWGYEAPQLAEAGE